MERVLRRCRLSGQQRTRMTGDEHDRAARPAVPNMPSTSQIGDRSILRAGQGERRPGLVRSRRGAVRTRFKAGSHTRPDVPFPSTFCGQNGRRRRCDPPRPGVSEVSVSPRPPASASPRRMSQRSWGATGSRGRRVGHPSAPVQSCPADSSGWIDAFGPVGHRLQWWIGDGGMGPISSGRGTFDMPFTHRRVVPLGLV